MFVCSFISSSNTLIPQIQMQTDYKNNNTANDNEHILILMVWSSSCITRRTTCTNVDLIQCKSYDKMQQSKSMVDAQVIILLNATINHPFCRSCRYVRCAVVKRTIFIVLKIPQYNFQLTTCTNMDSIQCTSYQDDMQQSKSMHFDTIQQSTIHFAALPS